MKPLVVKKGQIIKFDVKYGGEPEPEATWELEGKEIRIDGERYAIFHFSIDNLFSINYYKYFYASKSVRKFFQVFVS